MKNHIYLIGFMGTGKSTVARRLARRLNLPSEEMDEKIASEAGMPITEIFEKYGEEYFRDLETEMVKTLSRGPASVVSCGGGTVLREKNVECMRQSGMLILLTARPETVYQRVKNGTGRPVLNGHMNVEYIAGLMKKRQKAYEEACEYTIATDGKKPDRIAEEIIRIYRAGQQN